MVYIININKWLTIQFTQVQLNKCVFDSWFSESGESNVMTKYGWRWRSGWEWISVWTSNHRENCFAFVPVYSNTFIKIIEWFFVLFEVQKFTKINLHDYNIIPGRHMRSCPSRAIRGGDDFVGRQFSEWLIEYNLQIL